MERGGHVLTDPTTVMRTPAEAYISAEQIPADEFADDSSPPWLVLDPTGITEEGTSTESMGLIARTTSGLRPGRNNYVVGLNSKRNARESTNRSPSAAAAMENLFIPKSGSARTVSRSHLGTFWTGIAVTDQLAWRAGGARGFSWLIHFYRRQAWIAVRGARLPEDICHAASRRRCNGRRSK